ncbi:MAG: ATP-binding cassette domain-containing protein, partial [Thermoflexales bacterium]
MPAAADVAIDAQGLTKVFVARVAGDGPLRGWPRRPLQRTVAAVDGVTFQVRRGELVGLLGPNGAGKTTLLRLLATLLSPTAGAARVWGYDVRTDGARVRRHVGV